jgi:hypothetical protein
MNELPPLETATLSCTGNKEEEDGGGAGVETAVGADTNAGAGAGVGVGTSQIQAAMHANALASVHRLGPSVSPLYAAACALDHAADAKARSGSCTNRDRTCVASAGASSATAVTSTSSTPTTPPTPHHPPRTTLLVLDGTWQEAKRMYNSSTEKLHKLCTMVTFSVREDSSKDEQMVYAAEAAPQAASYDSGVVVDGPGSFIRLQRKAHHLRVARVGFDRNFALDDAIGFYDCWLKASIPRV